MQVVHDETRRFDASSSLQKQEARVKAVHDNNWRFVFKLCPTTSRGFVCKLCPTKIGGFKCTLSPIKIPGIENHMP